MNKDVELSRRKILAGIGAAGVASVGAGMGTSAYFNDTESFDGNTMAAGELDLKVDWQQTYNGPIPGSGGEVGEHPVNAYPDSAVRVETYGDGLQDLDGVNYSGAGETDPVFDAAEVPACCDCGEDEYYVTYAGESYCIEPIVGGESPEDFYDYSPVSSGNTNIQRDNAAVLFLYKEDENSEPRLFVLLDQLDNEDGGGYASFTIEGDLTDTDWQNIDWEEEDDPDDGSDDEYSIGSDEATADWIWGNNRTDGGVLGSLTDDFALRIAADLNGAARFSDPNERDFEPEVGPGVTSLMLLNGDAETEIVLEDELAADGPEDSDDDLDDIVVHSACGIDSGSQLETPAVFQSENYPDQENLIELDDVKPGDSGEITFSLHLCDNPGYVWLTAADFSQSGGANPEPEQVAEGDDNNDANLAENIDVTVWYDSDCDNVYDEEDETVIFEGTLAGLLDPPSPAGDVSEEYDFDVMRQLDANPEATETVDCFPAETGFCVGFEWEVSTDVGNIIQGDSATFDLGFYTEQCRHNDGNGPDAEMPT